jgi:hypothetical protein
LQGYYIAIPKLRRKTIFASYCDNILNLERKGYLKKYLFHAQYNMPYILIQVNDNIAKFFTLMVEGHLNKVMEFNAILASSWDICIYHAT